MRPPDTRHTAIPAVGTINPAGSNGTGFTSGKAIPAAIGAVTAAGMACPDVKPVPFDPAGLILPTAGIAV